MAWTTIQSSPAKLDEDVASFANGVTSIDNFDITSHSRNQVVALIRYTA